jgi:hypothetical protein
MPRWIQSEAQAYRGHQTALQARRDNEGRQWHVVAPAASDKREWLVPGMPGGGEGKRQWHVEAMGTLSGTQGPPGAMLKKPKAKKDPNAPKQGLSAFMFFCKEERPKVFSTPFSQVI